VNLNCKECPSSSLSDILFIHGNLASADWWSPTWKAWQDQGYRGPGSLLAVDLRGCGSNADWTAGQGFSLRDMAQDILQTLDHQGRERVGLVGHSLGGLLALQLMIIAPKRFLRCALLDSVGLQGVTFDDSMCEAFRQMAQSADLTSAVILSTITNEQQLDGPFKKLIGDQAFKAVKGIGLIVLENLRHLDISAEAGKILTPTLVLHGRHDAVIPLKDGEQIAATLPNASLEVLEDAGHCWNVENPVTMAQRLAQWFGETTRDRSVYENQSPAHFG
jgi:pimeloyl-ACP methyl ester carboxylesterase